MVPGEDGLGVESRRQGFPGVGQWSVYPQKQVTISSPKTKSVVLLFPYNRSRIDPDLSSYPSSKTQRAAYGLTKAAFF